MKVTPWNHYCPSEEQQQKLQGGSETEILQVAPSPENNKGLVRRGCTSLSCFGCAPKAGPTKDLESQDQIHSVYASVVEGDEEKVVGGVKSSLKKSKNGIEEGNADSNREEAFGLCRELYESESEDGVFYAEEGEGRRTISKNRALFEEDCSNDSAFQAQRRKVRWMDSIGGELFEIREFEMSDDDSDDSDDEFGHGNGKCMCAIM